MIFFTTTNVQDQAAYDKRRWHEYFHFYLYPSLKLAENYLIFPHHFVSNIGLTFGYNLLLRQRSSELGFYEFDESIYVRQGDNMVSIIIKKAALLSIYLRPLNLYF